jgi:hypothetical protein
MTTGRINQVTIVCLAAGLKAPTAQTACKASRMNYKEGAPRCPAASSGCTKHTHSPATIQLPPLSSSKNCPHQPHLGVATAVRCCISFSRGGNPSSVTPEGGYRLGPAPKDLAGYIGKLPTIHRPHKRLLARANRACAPPKALVTPPAHARLLCPWPIERELLRPNSHADESERRLPPFRGRNRLP